MIRLIFKIIVPLLALICLMGCAAIAQSREFKKTVDFTAGGELKVHSDRGSVRLSSWDQNQVEVFARIVKPDWAGSDFDPRSIDATKIDVIGDTRSLSIRANFDDVPNKDGIFSNGPRLPQVHFEIRAPRSLNLYLDVDRSEVELRGIEGKLDVVSDRTNVKADDIAGEIRLRADRGSVRVLGVRGKLNVRTDRGDVRLSGAQITGDSNFEINRGDLELSVPRSQGMFVSANTGRRAGFESDFPVSTRTFGDDRIEGAINGGGPKVVIRTDRGKARLRQE
jgi:hypothetical protein